VSLEVRVLGQQDLRDAARAIRRAGRHDLQKEMLAALRQATRPIADEVRELERDRMIAAMRETRGVQNRAAELIEMPLRTFVTKLKRYDIGPADWTRR